MTRHDRHVSVGQSLLLAGVFAALATSTALAQDDPTTPGAKAATKLPAPFATPSATKHVKVIGWPKDHKPTVPEGFVVAAFAEHIKSPRWIYPLPNGDVLVAQSNTDKNSSPNLITLFRDADHDGQPEVRETFIQKLNQPFGMALVNDTLYVGNTDALLAFSYRAGQTRIDGKGTKVLDLPGGGYNNHWTRNVIPNRDGSKLYISVGSASNVAEYGMDVEKMRANILEVNPDGSGLRVFASGLRNPVGMDWAPSTGALWTAVNERDELGDDLVPDYLTSVRDGGFYGWPYSYFGNHEDPRRKGERPDLVKKAIVPDVPLGAHTASLGLVFYRGEAFPEKYRGGAFVGQRGSWNRSKFAGYRVAFVPFKDGKPSGPDEDFLTGFLASDSEAYGRPVGVAVAADGAMLVADEPGNAIWRVSVEK